MGDLKQQIQMGCSLTINSISMVKFKTLKLAFSFFKINKETPELCVNSVQS